MRKFINTNWFNLIQMAVILVTIGLIYGKLETRVSFSEGILTEIRFDIKSMLGRVAAVEAICDK